MDRKYNTDQRLSRLRLRRRSDWCLRHHLEPKASSRTYPTVFSSCEPHLRPVQSHRRALTECQPVATVESWSARATYKTKQQPVVHTESASVLFNRLLVFNCPLNIWGIYRHRHSIIATCRLAPFRELGMPWRIFSPITGHPTCIFSASFVCPVQECKVFWPGDVSASLAQHNTLT